MTTATRNGPEEWRNAGSPETRSIMGKLRRMVIGVTSRVLWQVIGHKQLDTKDETHEAEVYAGANTLSRPGGRNAEAIVIFPGEGVGSPTIVAIRDQQMAAALQAAIAGGLAVGEHAQCAGVSGTVACLAHWKSDGTVEIRTAAGVALPLATKADIDALRAWALNHTHLGVTAGGGVTGIPGAPGGIPPAAVGTTCIKSH